MSNWDILYNDLINKHDYIKLNKPATEKQISDVEVALNIKLPEDLKELLIKFNGDNFLLFSTEQIIEVNLSLRRLECFMPLDCLLFFAGNGCGDYYGFSITKEHGVRENNIFMWEHEYDNRIWKASSLEDLLKKYYNDKI